MKLPKLIYLLLASLFLSCSAADARAQDYPADEDGRWILGKGLPLSFDGNISKEDITEVKSRWHKIDRAEDAAAQNEWAGQYGIYGSTHMTLMKWSPADGYVVLSINSCMGMIMRAYYGDVRVMGGQIFFYPKKASGMPHGDGGEMSNQNPAPYELIPAKWRGVNFLLSENEVKDFCAYAAGFNVGSDVDGLPFYAKGEESGAPEQTPLLPKRFENFIRKSINGKIVSIGKRKITKFEFEGIEPYFQSETQVVVNLGRADGLTDEMSVHLLNESTCYNGEEFELTEIGEKTSNGIIRRLVEEKPEIPPSRRKDKADYSPIKIGWKVTTSQHIYYDHCRAYETGNEQQ
jgi:hypothetical protein